MKCCGPCKRWGLVQFTARRKVHRAGHLNDLPLCPFMCEQDVYSGNVDDIKAIILGPRPPQQHSSLALACVCRTYTAAASTTSRPSAHLVLLLNDLSSACPCICVQDVYSSSVDDMKAIVLWPRPPQQQALLALAYLCRTYTAAASTTSRPSATSSSACTSLACIR